MAGSGEQFVPMYFVFVAIIFGALTFSIAERYGFPYPLIIFVEGALLGYWSNAQVDFLGDFSDSFTQWQDIDPFLLLAVFLPGLLFGDGMETETYQLQRIAPQLVILCLFGTLIMTGLMAVVAGYFLTGGTWKVFGCILFGAILSSPDPVILINLLESTTNAPEKYKLLTGSESHFCDMTSFTLFTVFLGIVTEGVEKKFKDAGSTVQFFAFNLLGGPLTGVLAGFIAYFLIVRTKLTGKPLDSVVQICITICCAYLAFLVSEHGLSGNGILATIIASLVLAAYAKASYVDAHAVETVWKVIEFLATTVVLFLSGSIAAQVVYDANLNEFGVGTLLVDVIITYCCLMVARCLTILLLYIPLNKVGDFSVKEAICMSWANVRGALTLTLAVAVVRIDTGKFEKGLNSNFFDSTIFDVNATANGTLRMLAEEESFPENEILKEQLSRFYLIIALTVLLTIAINFTLADRVFRITGLLDGYTRRAKVKDKTVRAYIDVRIRRRYREILHSLVEKYNNEDLVDLNFLDKRLIFFVKREYVKHLDGEVEGSSLGEKPEVEYSREELENMTLEDVEANADLVELNKMQALFYKALKQSYWAQIENGVIPKGSNIALKLLYSAHVGADEKMLLKSDFEALSLPDIDTEQKTIGITTFWGRFLQFMDKITPWELLEKHERDLLREAVYVCTCYIDAHQDAEEKIAGAMGAGAAIDTYEEAAVIKRSMLVVHDAQDYLEKAKVLSPDVEVLIETLKIGSAMIEGHQMYMSELKEEGLVEDFEVQKEFDLLAKQKKIIKNRGGFEKEFASQRGEIEHRGRMSSFLGSMIQRNPHMDASIEKAIARQNEAVASHERKHSKVGEDDLEALNVTDHQETEEEISMRKLVPPKEAIGKDV